MNEIINVTAEELRQWRDSWYETGRAEGVRFTRSELTNAIYLMLQKLGGHVEFQEIDYIKIPHDRDIIFTTTPDKFIFEIKK